MPDLHHESAADDEFERLFPGASLTHALTIVSRDQLGVALEALRALHASGGSLDALHLTRIDNRSECRLRVTGLRPREARALTHHLAAVPHIERVSVEHQILRASRI